MQELQPVSFVVHTKMYLDKIERGIPELSYPTWNAVFYWQGIKLEILVGNCPGLVTLEGQQVPVSLWVNLPFGETKGSIGLMFAGVINGFFSDYDLLMRNITLDTTYLPIKRHATCSNCSRMIDKFDAFLKDLCAGR